MNESGQIPTAEIGQATLLNEESIKILEEASSIVEESTKDKFPDLPASTINARSTEQSVF
jgi:division protein CdvB (Snf7/Vps24/ESCRT-III family)